MAKLLLGLSVLVSGVLVWACSTGQSSNLALSNSQGGTKGDSGGSTSTDTDVSPNGRGGGTGITIGLDTEPKKPDASVVFRRDKVCDDKGVCRCINLASFGARASSAYGTGSDGQPSSTTAFDTWLTEKSNANVKMVFDKPGSITMDYLNEFDVIILQDLRKWSFSSDELSNLEQWVKEGGGLIALNGYENTDDQEVDASNKVLAFTGMSYNGGATSGSVPRGDCPASSMDLCPQANAICCYCWDNTITITDWDTSHPVADPRSGFKAIGAYWGRSINTGDAQVVATYSGKTVAASKTIEKGKAFLWCDEWITYTSQWTGGQVDKNQTGEQLKYAPCYDSANEHWLTADHAFQTKQFWYNVISYVSPPTECTFVIDEPEVKIWNI